MPVPQPAVIDLPVMAPFRRRATVIVGAVAAIVVAAVLVVVAFTMTSVLASVDRGGELVAYIGALLLLLAVLGVPVVRAGALIVAMRRMRAQRPEAIVFLARRLPSIVDDTIEYQRRKGTHARIDGSWFPALVDARGFAVWNGGPRSREMLVVGWDELGPVEMVDRTGPDGTTLGAVAFDVHPFPIPMHVELGYAWTGVALPIGRRATADLVARAAALRPSEDERSAELADLA